jgi:hypothetical protein
LQGLIAASPPIRQAQRRLDQGAQLLKANRLGQIIESPRLERCHRIFGTAEGGNDRNRGLG